MIVTVTPLTIFMNSTSYPFPLLSCSVSTFCVSLMNIVSKLSSAPVTQNPKKENDPTSPGLPPQSKNHPNAVPPTLSTSALALPGNMDMASMGLSEPQLKRQALECLVSVLKSLVLWGTAATTSDPSGESHARSLGTEENQPEAVTPEPSSDRLNSFPNSFEASRQPTPEIIDDPSRFESAKQRKTTLLEGIKKFNFKPKRVCYDQYFKCTGSSDLPFY